MLAVLNQSTALSDDIAARVERAYKDGDGVAIDDVTFLPPLPDPGNFCALARTTNAIWSNCRNVNC